MMSFTRRLGEIKDQIYRLWDKQTLQRALGRAEPHTSPAASLRQAAASTETLTAKPSANDLFASLDQQLAHSPRYKVIDVFEGADGSPSDTMWSQTSPAGALAPVKSGR